MKTILVYDSVYGNTEKIAQVIAKALHTKPQKVFEVKLTDLSKTDLLVVGSPVHGGRATPAIDELFMRLKPDSLKNVRVAAFDTRFAAEDHGLGIRLLIHIIRYAAERIASELKKKGAHLIANPEGFIVKDKEGPLKKGELHRASLWAKNLLKGCAS